MRSLLVEYILSGHTRTAPNLSNAVDQFFTGVQMNDQLVQRMERSLSGAVANVKSAVHKHLLAPATALVYEIDQLYGLAASAHKEGSETMLLLSAAGTLQLLQSAQQLHLSVETALTARRRPRLIARLLRVAALHRRPNQGPGHGRHCSSRMYE